MTTDAQRHLMAAAMDFLVSHNAQVHYAETRPIPRLPSFAALEALVVVKGLTTDCSGSVTIICQVGGLEDPNGLGYNGAGNTQMMYNHLPHYTNPANANVGALCFFGVPGQLATQHITAVRHPGPDPVLFTHGHPGDPSYRKLSYMRSGFKGTPTFLNISHL